MIPGLSSDGVAPAAEIDTPIIIDIAQLTEAQMRTVLKVTGWPAELIEAALKVSWCESRWSPGAIGGTSWGLFQIQPSPWASYAGVYAQDLFDPIINAKVALAIVRYDEDRGMAPFKQWTCRP